MPDKPRHVSMQHIADRTNLSRSAVSLALRNHPSIPPATREKVRQAAEELGYTPNPLVTALMTQLRTAQYQASATIALVTKFPYPILNSQNNDFYRILGKSIYAAARAHGYNIDEFYDSNPRMSGRRLTQILKARNIHGIILFPGGLTRKEYPDLEWEHFSVVLTGFNIRNPPFNQVASDYLHDMDFALGKLHAYGYRRIGFAIPAEIDRSIDYSWLSRYLVYQQQQLPAQRRLPPAIFPKNKLVPDILLSWVRKNRPDAIIVGDPTARDILEAGGYRIPHDIGLLNMAQRLPDNMSGMDPNTSEVGATAVRTLSQQLQTNQHGVPPTPHLILIKGLWVEGQTLQPQNG